MVEIVIEFVWMNLMGQIFRKQKLKQKYEFFFFFYKFKLVYV